VRNLTVSDLSLHAGLKPVGTVGKKNFYHFRGAAFSKCNDHIFRKALMNCSWRFRKRILESIREFFSTGQSFDTATLDMTTANLRRDFILMFGTEAEKNEQYTAEADFLPLNQTPSYHDRYALLTELSKLRSNGPSLNSDLELSPSDQVSILISDTLSYVKKHTLEVEPEWLTYAIGNGKKIGKAFTVPNVAAADTFLDDLLKAKAEEERGIELSQGYQGFRALGFMGVDPFLFDPKIMEYEDSLITFILESMYDPNNATSMTFEKSDFGIPDLDSLLDGEK
jgi:hypothetical protein